MEQATNVPFKGKMVDSHGNSLRENYYNEGSNRRERRSHLHTPGGSKSKLYIFPAGKYKTVFQYIYKTFTETKTFKKHPLSQIETTVSITCTRIVNVIKHAIIVGNLRK
jgi:hypothetical protein